MKSEFELIGSIRRRIPKNLQEPLRLGDDAGLVGRAAVITTDMLVEGVDFLAKAAPEAIGRKALAVNLSDLAAMGARSEAFVIALGLPQRLSGRWVERFYAGLLPLARKYRVKCAGGDLSRASKIVVSIAALGHCPWGPLTRKGARPGDWIAVTGLLGGSILGRHLTFEPRLDESLYLAQSFKPTAMIDVSDGLIQDLGHLLKASKAGADLDCLQIPIAPAAWKRAKDHAIRALEHALTDGEDFELLFTVRPPVKARLEKAWRRRFGGLRLSWIGRVSKKPGLRWHAGKSKVKLSFKKTGYRHF